MQDEILDEETDLERILDDLEEKIERYGHAVVSTSAQTAPGTLSGFSYTVGLGRMGFPEIAVFALREDVARDLLNALARALQEGDLKTDCGIEGIVEGVDVLLKEADLDLALGFAPILSEVAERAGGVNRVWQVVWRDKAGILPWQAGFDEELRKLQPLLVRVN